MKTRITWCCLLAAGLLAKTGWTQAVGPAEASWSVQLESGRILPSTYVPGSISIATVVGERTFSSGELSRIDFARPFLCEVTTVHGDRWFAKAHPSCLQRLTRDPDLGAMWDQVRSVSFLGSALSAAKPAESWTAFLHNDSRITLVFEEAAVRLQNDAGRLDVPLGLVKNLRVQKTEWGIAAVLEILPGGRAIQGYVAGPPLRGTDLGGQAVAIPWEMLSTLTRTGRAMAKIADLEFEQSVTGRWTDGTELRGTLPVSVLSIQGSGGRWDLATTRLRQILRNPDGSFSAETTLGEWLTGKLEPRQFRGTFNGQTTSIPFSNCALLRWANPAEDMPEACVSWRLASGDLLVGQWQDESSAISSAPVPVPQVREASGKADRRVPVRINGQWPVSRFGVRHEASGKWLKMAPSAVESVLAVAPKQMPPAIRSSGFSAIRSDEVLLSGGSFRMGRTQGEGGDDEIPPVDLSVESFWMANTPVTVDQFSGFVAATRHVTDAERSPATASWRTPGFVQHPDDPVVCVSWRDAVKYCNWRSSVAGLSPCYEFKEGGRAVRFMPERNGYRLPLEAEWEYAARSGGRDVLFPWGDEAQESVAIGLANFRPTASVLDPWPWTNPVKAFPPSAVGLHDMGGNVWEWCQDVYQEQAYASLLRGTALASLLQPGAEGGTRRSMRGGSYHNPLPFLRCAARGFGLEQMSAPRVGFRVVRKAEPSAP